MVPRSVARRLAAWGYDPSSLDFGTNFLSSRIVKTKPGGEEDHYVFGSLCAVPHIAGSDFYSNFNDVANWLQPQSLIHYEPGGVWLPLSKRTFTSHGLILGEEDYSGGTHPLLWHSYLLAGRDGYFEYGRRIGRLFQGHWIYPFAPLIAWIQQFAALVQEAKTKQTDQVEYSIVLNLPHLQGAALVVLGDGWAEPFRWPDDPFPTPIETLVQLQCVLSEKTPKQVGRWFAERIDNVFGINEVWPRCYNHPNTKGTVGPPGELPTNRLSYG